MYPTFRPFRLQPPVAASGSWFGFFPELTARSADRIPFEDHGVTWASPLPSRLATTTGRIEFVILRTSRSPPVALHPPSRGRSYCRLQSSNPTSTGTSTLLIQYTHKRTRSRLPGGTLSDSRRFPEPKSRPAGGTYHEPFRLHPCTAHEGVASQQVARFVARRTLPTRLPAHRGEWYTESW